MQLIRKKSRNVEVALVLQKQIIRADLKRNSSLQNMLNSKTTFVFIFILLFIINYYTFDSQINFSSFVLQFG